MKILKTIINVTYLSNKMSKDFLKIFKFTKKSNNDIF